MQSKAFRRSLRKYSTLSEKALWQRLRNRQFMHLKFKRQHSIGVYIVDFYCSELKLVIELDGDIHDDPDQAANDYNRQLDLEIIGCQVYRIYNRVVIENIDKVLKELEGFIVKYSLIPNPSPGGRRE